VVTDSQPFALIVLLTGLVGLVAVMSNRLTSRTKIPTPVLLLVAAAIAVKVIPGLHSAGDRTVERLVTVALLVILFDGGRQVGVTRLRAAAAPIALTGVLGTLLTTVAAALLARYTLNVTW
jgi:cell volume regulation protein A